MLKSGHFKMLKIIDKFYKLVFEKFYFYLDNGRLKVVPPENLSADAKLTAKNYIEQNKNFITTTLKNNKNNPNIFLFNLSDCKVPLSFSQERLWFVDQYEQGTNVYNISLAFTLAKDVKVEILEKSIKNIVIRHEILRTVIKNDLESQSYQFVLNEKEQPFVIRRKNLDNLVELESELEDESNHVFSLSNEYPIRICLYSTRCNQQYYLSIIIHHIAFDGWSCDIFLNELEKYYSYFLEKLHNISAVLPFPDLEIQYRDFALWQKAYLSDKRFEDQLFFWKNKLADYVALNLATDKIRPSQIDYKGANLNFELNEELSNNLREAAKKLKVSLYTILLSGYVLMLRVYSHQDDIIIGTPSANRHYNQIENLIGCFVNSLAIRIKIGPNLSIMEFIQQVGNEILAAQLHQDFPLEKLVEELAIPKDTSRHPIFQALFSLQAFRGEAGTVVKKDSENLNAGLLEPYIPNRQIYNVAKLDISTYLDDTQVCIQGIVNYAVSLYFESTIKGFIETYLTILKQIAKLNFHEEAKDYLKISQLKYLTPEKYHQIITYWNKTEINYFLEKNNSTLHKLFEEQVKRSPNNRAVVYDGLSLTYKELNEKANQLSHYLKELGVTNNTLVAIAVERSIEMIIGLLGILKAGGAYVPLDPTLPVERLQFILNDIDVGIILTDKLTKNKLPATFGFVIALDEEKVTEHYSTDNLTVLSSSNDLAYVIYTSGTTGNPKGVMIEHKGVVNTILSERHYLNLHKALEKENAFGFFNNYAFDGSIPGIFLPLTLGYTMFIANDLIKENLVDFVKSHKITFTTITPKILNLLGEDFTFLKCLIMGGEKPDAVLVQKLVNSGVKVFLEYGLTECSVTSTYNRLTQTTKMSNIGIPMPNTKVYVLDNQQSPLPIGAIGELYIGGVGLARGYLNLPDYTSNKFIPNPFQTGLEQKFGENTMLYKTGDLVRWLHDGSLEYIGRNDYQIKLRGYRIELGEIEAVLSSYKLIKQCVVIIQETLGEKVGSKEHGLLIGYYESITKLDNNEIFDYLNTKLPPYMIPAELIHLESIPLTSNGKLDVKKLPSRQSSIDEYFLAPRDELEQKLSEIWAEVLNLPKEEISINDDFFKMGGDSIISIQLVSKLRQKLNLNVSVKDIFHYKNIQRLHDFIISENFREENNFVLNYKKLENEQGILTGEFPLLPIQQWFFDNSFIKANHWNQSFILRVPSLDLWKLKASLDKLICHHDGFRLKFKKDHTEYYQYYAAIAEEEDINLLDVSTIAAMEGTDEFHFELNNIFTKWQSGFDLEQGTLYKFGYLYGYKDGSARIFFIFHHLIVDTVSWRILAEDLRDIYNGIELEVKGSSYRQWVNVIKEYSTIHEHERVYWLNVLSDYNNQNNNFKDLIKSDIESNEIFLALSQQQTTELLRDSNKAYNTQINDILLTALAYSLYEITNCRVHHILLEGHGREEINNNIDITKTMGWFTSMYPIRLEITDKLESSLKKTKETLRQVPNKGVGYGALFGYILKDLPKIGFNYLGQFDKEKNLNALEDYWKIVGEASGEPIHHANQDPNLISLNGLIVEGKLQFNIKTKLDRIVANKLGQQWKVQLLRIIDHTVSQKRCYLTPSDIDNILSQEALDKLQSSKEISAVYLANSLQQGFILHALRQGEVDDAYQVQFIWKYHNNLDIEYLKLAWEYAQKRFDSLRLRFFLENEIVQVIDKEASLEWKFVDLSEDKEQVRSEDLSFQEMKLKAILEKDKLLGYKLHKGNLFRVTIVKQKVDLYTCIFSYHHAILDGWSSAIVFQYVHDTYLKLLRKEFPNFAIDFSYQSAQKYLQDSRDINKDYWLSRIDTIEERPDFSGLLLSHLQQKNFRISEYKHILNLKEEILSFENKLYYGLKKLSLTAGITLNTLLQYAWHKTLSIYGGVSQTIVGTTVSGRNLPIDDIGDSVGLYINTLPLIINHQNQKDKSIIEFLKEIQESINEMNSRSNINLAILQKGGERLFDSLFIYENFPSDSSSEVQSFFKITFEEANEKFDYPLAVTAFEDNNKLVLRLRYAGELFDKKLLIYFLLTIKNILENIIEDPNQPVTALQFLDKGQRQEIFQWNEVNSDYRNETTFQEIFSEQVLRTPNNIAVQCGTNVLTYKELDEHANKLANYIRNRYSIVPETPIAFCLERNEYLLIGILAIMKAGAAYVPIDPNYPIDRIKFILEDSNAPLILVNEIYKLKFNKILKTEGKHYVDITENLNTSILVLDNIRIKEEINISSKLNPVMNINGNHLIYILYTSGTTGNPKGVMVSHKAFIVTLEALGKLYFNNDEEINTYSMIHYVFDIFGLEYGLPLLSGGYIHVGSNECEKLDCSNYSFVQMTPSLCDIKLDYIINGHDTKLFIGGESLNIQLLRRALDKFPEVINVYGPTETVIWSTSKLYSSRNDSDPSHVSIGKPLVNEKTYVLDENLALLPVGAIGELYIGGEALARGYLNKPDLTQNKFIPNPFQVKQEIRYQKNERLYRTGDRVRWLPDGNLVFLNRNDSQIKLRGHRIELADIEATILCYGGIKQCVAILLENEKDMEDGKALTPYLVGYYVSSSLLNENNILSFLKEKLPDYMVPTQLIHLKELPLTVNGKLDRKALPSPRLKYNTFYQPPRNESETVVQNFFSEILGVLKDKIGIYDDFFQLGGNSILAIKLMVKLNEHYYSKLKVSDIYSYKTISSISKEIIQRKNNYRPLIKLNNAKYKTNLFMIHPGAGGCEVYGSLANKLKDYFNCYGVDSYNLYNEVKINTMTKLSQYYLSQIDELMEYPRQDTYHLLGWSLGGQISLKIAELLEDRGVSQVYVYLLDTILYDEYMLSSYKEVDINCLKKEYKVFANSKGYDKLYVDRIVANIELEGKFIQETSFGVLHKTKILFFKAMLQDVESKIESLKKIYEYASQFPFKNIDKIITDKSKIKIIRVEDAHHHNIINQEELLTKEIINFSSETMRAPSLEPII